MNRQKFLAQVLIIFSLMTFLMIAGCSSSSSSSTLAPTTAYTVTGTAATGTAIAGATVTLVDSTGKTATGTTGTDGSFTISGSTVLTPPFMLMVTSSGTTLYSISADSGTTTTINITPLTDMIIRSWYSEQGYSIATAFSNLASYPPPTPTEVQVISSTVMSIMSGWLQAAGVDASTFNPISTPFTADTGTGVDGVLDQTTVIVNSTTGAITVTITGSSITQNSTLTPASGTVTVSTTQTMGGSTTTPVATTTIVPTSSAQLAAIEGIEATIINFVNTVNTKGSALAASDLASYVATNFLGDGYTGSQWETTLATALAGGTYTFSGIQINSLDTTNNVASVAFQLSTTGGGVQLFLTNFNLINGTWLMSGDGNIASTDADAIGGDDNGSYTYTLALEIDDPQQNNVQSVTVSGPGINSTLMTIDPTITNGSITVPIVCSYNSADCNSGSCPPCENMWGNIYGFNEQRVFYMTLSGWPSVPSAYTFTLTTASGSYTYTSTVNAEFGSSPADYGVFTFTTGTPTLSQVINGITLTGSVYVPIWVDWTGLSPHFIYTPDGASTAVNNLVFNGTWDSGFAMPGQMNNFTLTIPAATINNSYSCSSSESGTCYNITVQGVSGNISDGWTEFNALYFNINNNGHTTYGFGIY